MSQKNIIHENECLEIVYDLSTLREEHTYMIADAISSMYDVGFPEVYFGDLPEKVETGNNYE